MAIVTTDTQHYQAVADAIREAAESGHPLHTQTFTPADMAEGIRCLTDHVYGCGWNAGVSEGETIGYAKGRADGAVQGKRELLEQSRYLNATVSGRVVTVDDASSVEQELAVRVGMPELSFSDFSDQETYYQATLPPNGTMPLENGKTYTVVFDGIPYTCTAETSFGGVVYLGNISPTNGMTYHEPFALFYNGGADSGYPLGYTLWVFADSAPSSCRIRVLEQGTVLCYGKNLFHLRDFTASTTSSEIEVKDGVLTIRYKTTVQTATPLSASRMSAYYTGVPRYPAGTYTFYVGGTDSGYGSFRYPSLEVILEDGSTAYLTPNKPVHMEQSFKPNALKFLEQAMKHEGDVYTTTLQVVAGEGEAYTPFVEPTCTVGTVPNRGSYMTLIPQTVGAVVECRYLRDIDRYIDKLTGGA